jgi:hypothetical protein
MAERVPPVQAANSNEEEKMKTIHAAIAAIVATVGLTACGRHYQQHDFSRGMNYIAGKIELDELQQAELESLNREYRNIRDELQRDHQRYSRELILMLDKGQIDRDRLLEIISADLDEIETFTGNLVEKTADFLAGLTDDQKEELARLAGIFESRHSRDTY